MAQEIRCGGGKAGGDNSPAHFEGHSVTQASLTQEKPPVQLARGFRRYLPPGAWHLGAAGEQIAPLPALCTAPFPSPRSPTLALGGGIGNRSFPLTALLTRVAEKASKAAPGTLPHEARPPGWREVGCAMPRPSVPAR